MGNTANLHVGRISRGRSELTLRAESFRGWLRPGAETSLFSVLLPALRKGRDTGCIDTMEGGGGSGATRVSIGTPRQYVSVAGKRA